MATPSYDKAGEEHGATCIAFPPGALAARSSRYTPGVVLSGKYRLESILGEGGMGEVWSASNLLLDLPVAIKLIRADLDKTVLRARLQLEARSAAKLGHPAIVRVYDVGESEHGDPFIVMELLRGETLSKLIARGRLSAARAVQLLLPIVDALAVAHSRGIVHRDLKPDNLMIVLEQQRTQPKILDFGVAKLTDPRDSGHKLTEVGMIVGSPEYMSPEQARGRDDVDASSDIWAVCVVLYEAVTGSTPFAAGNYHALLRAIVEDDPVSLVDHAAGDLALWEIVKRGLAKDRCDRYPSISELGRVLAGWLITHGVFEDACGTSVESKWFSADPDKQPNSSRSGSTGTLSADFRPKITHDSNPHATGTDLRGPFTRTIRPRSSGTRTLQIALGACALLAVLAFGLTARHSERSLSTVIAAARPVAPALPSALVAAEPVAATAAATLAAAPTQAPKNASQKTAQQEPAPPARKTLRTPHTAASSTVNGASKPRPNSAASPTPPADVKPSNKHPLDLLAPY